MEELRKAARESLQQQPDANDLPAITLPDNIALPDSLGPLWRDLSSQISKSDAEVSLRVPTSLGFLWQCIQISEGLLVAQGFLDRWDSKSLPDRDEEVMNYLYEWASDAALPGPVFGNISDPEGISKGGYFHYVFLHTGMTDTLQ